MKGKPALVLRVPSETRFLVLPMRPAGTEGWDEDRLAALVTRNSMIGTERDLKAEPA